MIHIADRRLKVYRLNEDWKWDDQGTGHVTVLERSGDLLVMDEEDNKKILLHGIGSCDMYRRQEDTIISWRDPEFSTELALSFQEVTGCSYIWDHICSLQRNMHFSSLANETLNGISSELRELPPVEISALPSILKIVESGITDRFRVTGLILNDQDFFRKLIELFRRCRDLEISDHLHLISKIVRGIISLNSAQIFEKIFGDGLILDIMGCLDYSVGSGAQTKDCSTAADNSKKQDEAKKKEKGKEKTGLHINIEDLKQHFGKRLEDVAEELGVGRSTMKRVLRKHNISRWPNNKKYKNNPSLFMKESATEVARDFQQNMQPSSSGNHPTSEMPLHQNVPQTNTESNQHLTVQVEAEKVIIKVKCGDDVIRLDFCLSSGIDMLLKEVAAKLSWEKGSFKLKYVDEDNDEILLVSDDDLQHCPKSLTASGKTFIRLFVQLIPK